MKALIATHCKLSLRSCINIHILRINLHHHIRTLGRRRLSRRVFLKYNSVSPSSDEDCYCRHQWARHSGLYRAVTDVMNEFIGASLAVLVGMLSVLDLWEAEVTLSWEPWTASSCGCGLWLASLRCGLKCRCLALNHQTGSKPPFPQEELLCRSALNIFYRITATPKAILLSLDERILRPMVYLWSLGAPILITAIFAYYMCIYKYCLWFQI